MAQELNRTVERSSPVKAGRSLQLLIVDNDPLNQAAVEPLLAEHGFTTRFVSQGAQAIQAIKSRVFDIVFINLLLPDMTGAELCQKVRAWEGGSTHLPLIAMFTLESAALPVELLKWGLDDFITKPYDLRQISRVAGIYVERAQDDLEAAAGQEQQGTGPESSPAVLDVPGAIEIFFAGSAEDYREMLRLFVMRLPKRMERMRNYYQAGAWQDLARECHNARSITASLGALQFSQLANRLEKYCEDGRIQSSRTVFEEIEKCAESVQVEAQAFLDS